MGFTSPESFQRLPAFPPGGQTFNFGVNLRRSDGQGGLSPILSLAPRYHRRETKCTTS